MKNHVIFIIIVTNLVAFKAVAQNIGYRVTSPDKTIIQIARDAYKDERLWKKIAQWNNIKSPYKLHPGQVLVLPSAPTQTLPPEQLVTGAEVPQPTPDADRPSVEQNLISSGQNTIYIVNERAPSLWMVGRELYGNEKMGAIIAKWNRIPADSKLALNQKLILKRAPTIPVKVGTETLINVWSQLGNIDMVRRLGGDISKVAVKEIDKPFIVKIQNPSLNSAPEKLHAASNNSEKKRLPAEAAKQNKDSMTPPVCIPPAESTGAAAAAAPAAKPTSTETAAAETNSHPETQTAATPTPDKTPSAAPTAAASATTPTPAAQPEPQVHSTSQAASAAQPASSTSNPAANESAAPSPQKTASTAEAQPTTSPVGPKDVVPEQDPELAAAEESSVDKVKSPAESDTNNSEQKSAQADASSNGQRAPASEDDEGSEPKDDAYWLGSEMPKILKTISNTAAPEK